MMAKIDIQHIPYKGNNPALTDTLGGHVHMLVRGSSRGAAASGIRDAARHRHQHPKRSPAMPAVPTFDESGVKGYEATNWFGLLAPAKTPQEAVDRMNRAVDGVILSPDFRERFVREGLEAGRRVAGVVRQVSARGDRQIRQGSSSLRIFRDNESEWRIARRARRRICW
jgi:tripartite-type tricarboxylate transporter receptor subunit TctC